MLDRFILKRIDKVCLVSPHMRRLDVINRLSSDKVEVIENGLPVSTIKGDGAPPEDITDFTSTHAFNLLAVGRLSPEKNFGSVIRALSSDQLRDRDIGLCIVGEGKLRERLNLLRDELGLTEQVRFLGYRTDVVEMMRAFDLLVMPSLTEGLPITILEAMREGLPVLASNVGGMPHALDNGNAGATYEINHDAGLQINLLKLVKNRKFINELAESAKQHFEIKFSSISMADSYRRVYRELKF